MRLRQPGSLPENVMPALPISRMFWLLLSGTILYAEQPERALAVQWADYYASEYAVPPELVHAIIQVESAWRPNAISNKGAVGLMQLMPATAVTFGVTNRFEIEQNIRAGVAYLGHLLELFHGDVRLVAAAYMAGEKRITSAGLGYSNAEVFDYVQKVVRLYRQKRQKSENEVTGGNSP